MTDKEARQAILNRFYDAYRRHGLYVIVNAGEVATELSLDQAQAKRCFDYLSAKGLLKPLTLSGGFGPTVELVDAIEAEEEKNAR